MRGIGIAIGALCFVTSGAGCQKAPRPASYGGEISGTVLFRGEPMTKGTITFVLDDPKHPDTRPGIATIEPDGSFVVGNANPDKPSGVPPGKYRIMVLSMQGRPQGAGQSPIATMTTPEQYADLTTTPLSVEILPGENVLRVDLDQAAVLPQTLAKQDRPATSR